MSDVFSEKPHSGATPRPPRPDYLLDREHRKSFNDAGHAHELTFCCFHRHPFLSKERPCQWLAESIQAACTKLDFSLWAFVFMPDHVHLIVHPNDPVYDVADFLAQTKHPTSRRALAFLRKESPGWLKKLKQQSGKWTEYHFWQQGGGYDRNITTPTTLEAAINYIHMNPVRKGLVTRAIDWNWSSATWFVSHEQHRSLPVDLIPYEWTSGMDS